MALSPKDCLELSAEEQASLLRLEDRLDGSLMNIFEPGRGIATYNFDSDRPPNKKVIDAIIERYLAVGWKRVWFNPGNGSDSAFLQFEAEPAPGWPPRE